MLVFGITIHFFAIHKPILYKKIILKKYKRQVNNPRESQRKI